MTLADSISAICEVDGKVEAKLQPRDFVVSEYITYHQVYVCPTCDRTVGLPHIERTARERLPIFLAYYREWQRGPIANRWLLRTIKRLRREARRGR